MANITFQVCTSEAPHVDTLHKYSAGDLVSAYNTSDIVETPQGRLGFIHVTGTPTGLADMLSLCALWDDNARRLYAVDYTELTAGETTALNGDGLTVTWTRFKECVIKKSTALNVVDGDVNG